MSGKLEDSIIRDCIDHCSSNELVVVPSGIGDVGLSDYFSEKSKALMTQRNLATPPERCGLALRFPEPNQGQSEIDEFFESPRAFSHNRPFLGCFMIDITSYRNNPEHSYFQQLKTFMSDNSDDMVFVLVLEADNISDVNRIRRSISTAGVFRTVSLKKPSPERIAAYIDESLGRKASEPEDVLSFFGAHPDFRIADNFIEYTRRVLTGSRRKAFASFRKEFESYNSYKNLGY